MSAPHQTQHLTGRPERPEQWWRTPCLVTPQLVLCGDLDTSTMARTTRQLAELTALGVTDIVDTRGEASDAQLVAALRPDLSYHHIATHDDGHSQPYEWFERGVNTALSVLSEKEGSVLVHCHMGVNRAPSLMLAILLALGHEPVKALEMIRGARPIAAVLYALDALSWWHHASDVLPEQAARQTQEVQKWLEENPVDVGWVVSRIAWRGARA